MTLTTVSLKRGGCKIRHLTVETERGLRKLEEDMVTLANKAEEDGYTTDHDLLFEVQGVHFKGHKVET